MTFMVLEAEDPAAEPHIQEPAHLGLETPLLSAHRRETEAAMPGSAAKTMVPVEAAVSIPLEAMGHHITAVLVEPASAIVSLDPRMIMQEAVEARVTRAATLVPRHHMVAGMEHGVPPQPLPAGQPIPEAAEAAATGASVRVKVAAAPV